MSPGVFEERRVLPGERSSAAALACGVFSILLSCAYGIGLVPGIAALILGKQSQKHMAAHGHSRGTALAGSGIAAGSVGVILSFLFLAFVITALHYGLTFNGNSGSSLLQSPFGVSGPG